MWAEIDSDSHLNLITEDYYFYLANNTKITYINEPPTSFSGMGMGSHSQGQDHHGAERKSQLPGAIQ